MKLEITNEKFNGHVVLPDFLNILQVRAFEDSMGDLNEQASLDEDKKVWISIGDEKRLPVVLSIVKEWHVEGVGENPTLETFPMTPLLQAHALITEIYTGIYRLWLGEQVPNA